eukprot:3446246-Prymnesium_polylepis.1
MLASALGLSRRSSWSSSATAGVDLMCSRAYRRLLTTSRWRSTVHPPCLAAFAKALELASPSSYTASTA